MITITDILPPPQTLETLDAWGDLDSLPFSLDSAIWLACGMYGVSGSLVAQSSGTAAFSLVVSSGMSGTASSSESAELATVIYENGMAASADSAEAVSFALIIGAGRLAADGTSADEADASAIYAAGTLDADGMSAEIADGIVVFGCSGEGYAESGEYAECERLLDLECGAVSAESLEACALHCPGREWKPKGVTGGDWQAVAADGSAWRRETAGSNDWTPIPAASDGWKRIERTQSAWAS